MDRHAGVLCARGSSSLARIILKISRARVQAGRLVRIESFYRFFSFVCCRYVQCISQRADTASPGDRAILTAITYVSLHVYSVSILIMNEAVAYTARLVRSKFAHDLFSRSLQSFSPPIARLLCAYFISFP